MEQSSNRFYIELTRICFEERSVLKVPYGGMASDQTIGVTLLLLPFSIFGM